MRSALKREIEMQEMAEEAEMTEEEKERERKKGENKNEEGFTVVQGAV